MKRFLSVESLVVASTIFLAIFFAKFPTLYHWLNTPAGYWYPKQTSWFDAWDTNFQVSYIRYGQRDGLALQNTYTTTPHKPVFIYQYYTALGVFNRLLHFDPFILFHLASIITSTILLLVSYFICRLFFKDILYRISAFIVIALGGGFAWVPYLSFSADSKIAGFTLVNALERGHDAFSTFILLFTFISTYLYTKTSNARYIFWGAIAGVVGMTFHPPLVGLYIFLGIVTASLYYIQHKKIILFSYPAILVLAFIIYGLLVFRNLLGNPGFAGVVGQNLFDVDSLSFALGFGLLSPFIFWSLINLEDKSKELFSLKVFFLVQLFFLFLPFGFHLYYVKGMFVWGILLGIFGIRNLITDIKIQRIVLTIIVVTSLMMRLNIFTILTHPNVNNSFFFLAQAEGEALAYLATLPKDSGIMSLYRIGNYIPAYTDNRVYYGHKFQTPQGAEKLNRAKHFYVSDDEKSQREFLKLHNIQYIYYGLEEAKVRQDAKLDTKNPFPNYPVIYQKNSLIIYAATISAQEKTNK